MARCSLCLQRRGPHSADHRLRGASDNLYLRRLQPVPDERYRPRRGPPVTRTSPDRAITQDNALAFIAFPDGTHQYYAYDVQGRLSQTALDGNADAMQYAYTSPGGMTMTNASGATDYDALQ